MKENPPVRSRRVSWIRLVENPTHLHLSVIARGSRWVGGSKQMEALYTPIDRNVKVPWSSREFCPRASTLLATHKHLSIHRIIPIRCKCWSCDYCAEKNSARLKEKILSGNPTKFITLTTICQSGESPKETTTRCRKQIARLLTKIRKEWGPIECAIVLELTKRGLPHWHLCARCGFIDQHWLSREWQKLTGARVVDIRKIRNPKNAVHYVAKYTSKTAKQTARMKLGRLYSFTSNYLMREQTNPQEQVWSFKRLAEHPLEVLRKWPASRLVEYHDGLFDLINVNSQSAADAMEFARPPPGPTVFTSPIRWTVATA